MRPSLFSLITVAGLVVGSLIGGSVIVETLFGINGLGRVTVNAIQSKDYPVVQAGILVSAGLFLVINTLVDLTYYLTRAKDSSCRALTSTRRRSSLRFPRDDSASHSRPSLDELSSSLSSRLPCSA